MVFDDLKVCAVANVPQKISNIVELLKIQALDETFAPETDRIHLEDGTLYFNGCFVDIKESVVRTRLPVRYNPYAPKPERWLSFLDELLYPEDIPTLQEFIGYCLIPSNKGQRMMIIKGNGGEGKSQIKNRRTEAYNSYGNGSAMRVSPVGWYAKSLDEAENLAKATAEVTHNHPEGIKGAVSVAGAIYLARTGAAMAEIKEYVSRFYYIDFTLDEIRPDYGFYETCQDSVPQAFEAFFESVSFEDAIRNAISIGGDSDTIAAITGSVAEGFYGISDNLKETAVSYLDERLLKIYQDFNNKTEVK